MAGEKRRGLTAAELDALPLGSVVIGSEFVAWQKQPLSDGRWGAHMTGLVYADQLVDEHSPLRRMVVEGSEG
jgi:hypothetical protein